MPIIEATLPVVGDNIARIAGQFYQHMFKATPELLDGSASDARSAGSSGG